MKSCHLTQQYQVIQDPIFTQIDDEIVLMGPEDDLYYALNSVGAALWSMMASKPMDIPAMMACLKQSYDIPDDEAAITDLKAFIDVMITKNLLMPIAS